MSQIQVNLLTDQILPKFAERPTSSWAQIAKPLFSLIEETSDRGGRSLPFH